MVAQTQVARSAHRPFLVRHDDRNRVVVVNHAQHEVQIRRFVGRRQRTHGFRPHAHLGLLFGFEVGDQPVRNPQRNPDDEHRHGHQYALHAPHTIVTHHAFS